MPKTEAFFVVMRVPQFFLWTMDLIKKDVMGELNKTEAEKKEYMPSTKYSVCWGLSSLDLVITD